MYQVTFGDITYEGYLIQYPSALSSVVENIEDRRNSLVSAFVLRKEIPNSLLYHGLVSLLETDWSSIRPYFEIKNETFSEYIVSKELFPAEMYEHNIVVRIPPKKRYAIEMDVKSIRKGEPIIIEPEDFL